MPGEMGRLMALLSRKPSMHSDDKLVWFYKTGAFALLLAAVALQIGVMSAGAAVSTSIDPPTGDPTAACGDDRLGPPV